MQATSETPPPQQLSGITGLVLITEDSLSVAPLVAELLQRKGANPCILGNKDFSDSQTLKTTVESLKQKYGSVTGIVHLAPLDTQPIPQTLADWRQLTQLHTKDFFSLLQLCAYDLQENTHQPGRVLAASCFGGYFGRTATESFSGLPTAGANIGLLKTLVTEWNRVQAKAVDFDPKSGTTKIAERVVQELLMPGGRLEVGYPQDNRTIFHTVSAPFASTPSTHAWIPTADAIVLATGGARGITSEMVAKLVVPGLTLIITGQSPLLDLESEATRGTTSVSQLRQLLIQQVQEQGLTVTPIQIEKQLQALLRDRTIRQNLERLMILGAKVEYISADVRDIQGFGNLINSIYQHYGRLDAVIHGAGIIEDKLITDKNIESFNRVFDTKVDSAFILSRYLRPESLKLLVLFTSVAGRYGNRGQVDYAAANEIVNRLAWQLNQQWPDTRVVTINWGPWDTTGMASEEVKRKFREQGIIPIPLNAGCNFFVDELQKGLKSEVEIIAGEGRWEAYEAEQEKIHNHLPNKSAIAADIPQLSQFVLLSQKPQLQANSTVTLDHTLSIDSDPYLSDHRLDHKPVMPATGALEWLAEFVQAAWPEWIVTEVQNLQVLRGLILNTSAGRKIQFRAKASSHADAESLQVSAEIIDPELNLLFYRATLILRPALEIAPTINIQSLNSLKILEREIVYNNYLFHGTQFQLITAINGLNEAGINAQVIPSDISGWKPLVNHQAKWLFDPGLLDTAPQLAIVWSRIHHNTTALPSRMGSVIRYSLADIQYPLQLAFRITQVSSHNLTYDAFFLDSNGKVRLQMQEIESTCNSALNRLATNP
jgi:NAD(P)-dependent dehydrogenase (short-subunit alcohol dehydrogenase family)